MFEGGINFSGYPYYLSPMLVIKRLKLVEATFAISDNRTIFCLGFRFVPKIFMKPKCEGSMSCMFARTPSVQSLQKAAARTPWLRC